MTYFSGVVFRGSLAAIRSCKSRCPTEPALVRWRVIEGAVEASEVEEDCLGDDDVRCEESRGGR